MENFKRIIGKQLFWKQPSPRQLFFEMRADEKVHAALKFEKDHNAQAIAKTSIQDWKFIQEGIIKPKYNVRKHDSEEVYASYSPKFRKGVLTINEDQEYQWLTTNPWQTRWSLLDSEGNTLLKFSEDNENVKLWAIYRIEWIVEIIDQKINPKLLSMLIPFFFYILATKRKNSQQRQFLPVLLKKEEELDF